MRKLTRRELLKVSLGTMGALALANLPNWNKPALRVGVLPAHAQTSLDLNDLLVRLTWDTGETEPSNGDKMTSDLDLEVWEPDGSYSSYNYQNGTTGHGGIDNQWGFGPEVVYVLAGDAMDGTYEVWIDMHAGPIPTTATVRVEVFTGTPQYQVRTYTYTFTDLSGGETKYYPGDDILICTITFPGGIIAAAKGQRKSTRPEKK